jgi:hypothetical protein
MIAFDEILMRENTIHGALTHLARVGAIAPRALLGFREFNAAYGEQGRLRGPAAGSRLTRTA